jgi:FMN-dependent NADH-azoreductase
MPKLLRIDSSPMGERSISRALTSQFTTSWLQAHPTGEVITRDLTKLEIPVVDSLWVTAAFTPPDQRNPDQNQVLRVSESLVADLEDADEYVFGVPMHNFSIPAGLKLWIDQVMRAVKTFAYTANGPTGLLTGKKATLLMASGGVYEAGSAMAALNFVSPYLRTVLGFMGINHVTIISAEGAAQVARGAVDPQAFLAPSLEKVRAHASL